MQQGFNEEKPDEDLDLTKWSEQWLQTKGISKIQAEVEEDGGKYTKFNLRQSAHKNSDDRRRQQKINIGFYGEEGNLIRKFEKVLIKD